MPGILKVPGFFFACRQAFLYFNFHNVTYNISIEMNIRRYLLKLSCLLTFYTFFLYNYIHIL